MRIIKLPEVSHLTARKRSTIYKDIAKYYPKAKDGQYWQEGIRGVVYREMRYGRNFKMVDKGVVGLL